MTTYLLLDKCQTIVYPAHVINNNDDMRNHSEEATMNTRDFLRGFAAIVRRPRSSQYMIVSHGKPVGYFLPYEWTRSRSRFSKKKQITIHDLERVRFHSGKRNLCTSIDSIVYGV